MQIIASILTTLSTGSPSVIWPILRMEGCSRCVSSVIWLVLRIGTRYIGRSGGENGTIGGIYGIRRLQMVWSARPRGYPVLPRVALTMLESILPVKHFNWKFHLIPILGAKSQNLLPNQLNYYQMGTKTEILFPFSPIISTEQLSAFSA